MPVEGWVDVVEVVVDSECGGAGEWGGFDIRRRGHMMPVVSYARSGRGVDGRAGGVRTFVLCSSRGHDGSVGVSEFDHFCG